MDTHGEKSKKTDTIKPTNVTDAKIKAVFDWVVSEYQQAGGIDDNLSKTKEFSLRLERNWSP